MSRAQPAVSEDPRTEPWPYVIAIGAAVAVFLYLAIWARRYGLDLRVYRDSVQSWESGRDPYSQAYTDHRLAFTYPPFALVALSPLAWLSFSVTQWLLWIASIGAATGSVLLVLRDRGIMVTPRLWCAALAWTCISVLVLEPARSGIDYGQIEFILMFMVVADLLIVPGRYRGIVLGIAAGIKLTPLVFILLLALKRDVSSIVRCGVSFLSCAAVSLLFGPGLSRIYWLHDLSHPARIGGITYGGNQSWYAILHRPPFSASDPAVTWLAFSIGMLAVSSFVAWRCLNVNANAFAVVVIGLGGLLASPISWSHHWVWVLLVPPMILASRSDPYVPMPVQWMLWGLIALTIVSPYWWFGSGVQADIFDALLPVWTSIVLIAWAGIEFSSLAGRRSAPFTANDSVW